MHKPLQVPPEADARAAGLRYVSDAKPGIERIRKGKDFAYRKDGRAVRDRETLRRIRSLVIPPAWTDVWICPIANGHIQAVGRDARGRKQYRYHPRWREVRDESKFTRMLAFAEALPGVRRSVAAHLGKKGMEREKVLSAVVRLLETTLIRVGNDEYARHNKSFGLTTLRNRHVKVRGRRVLFRFLGKSGKTHEITLEDPRIAKIVRKCQDLPGQELFAYTDETGAVQDVTSDDVNRFLMELTGADFTAKDFRTWAGTVLAALALREFEQFASNREAKRNITMAIESVSKMLGNTPAICRKCYVHPAILESYLQGETISTLRQAADKRLKGSLRRLKPEEAAVLMLLRERLAAAEKKPSLRQALRKSLR